MRKSTERQYQLTAAEVFLAASLATKGQPFGVVTSWGANELGDQRRVQPRA